MNNKRAWTIWRIWSTGLIIICVLIVIFLAVMIMIGGNDNSILLNWGVYLPKPQSRDRIIDTVEFQDGTILDIYTYNKNEMEEVIRSEYITLIDESNIKDIEKCLSEFEEFLDNKEKDIFNKNIDKVSLLTNENYFAIIPKQNDRRTWLLLIIESKTNLMYCFGYIF